MEDEFFGILYRSGPETASNTIYMWHLNEVLTTEQEGAHRVEFVRRYNHLSGEKVERISREVEKYSGPPGALIQKIDEILGANKLA